MCIRRKWYVYLVTYADLSGIHSCEVSVGKKINSLGDLGLIALQISKMQLPVPEIISFSFLRGEGISFY